jgi:AcrR family transcriptional regulator
MATRRCDLTRDKLLQAAFGEIHRSGFQAASIAKLLGDAGLTKGALYHYFPSKRELGLAVIDEVVGPRLDEAIFTPLRESGRPLQTLLDLLQEKIKASDPELIKWGCPLNNLMQEMSPLDDGFKDKLTQILQAWCRTVADALTRAQAQGAVAAGVDCEAAALYIVASLEGCIGVAKSLQSTKAYQLCLEQLHAYVCSLGQQGAR